MRLRGTRLGSVSAGQNLDPLWAAAGAIPSLDLRFAEDKSLVDRISGQNLITFTRASSGTYVGSDGVLQTATTNEPRFDHNPTTGESLGLLVEEQRSNLLLNSGTLSTQSVTVTAVAHTLSFTGTGTITLTGASTAGPLVGTGTGEANRVSLTFTPTAGSLTLTVSGTVTNAQLEDGAFGTSYIPTTTAAATRAADVASITGSNFSSWYRQDEGTVFASAVINGASNETGIAGIANSGESDFLRISRLQTTSRARSLVFDDSVAQVDTQPTNTITIGQTFKLATTLKQNDFSTVLNGGTAAADTSGTMPTVDRMTIGTGAFLTQLNGRLARLTYFPQRLPDSILQSITI